MNRLTRAALTCVALSVTTLPACNARRLSAPPPVKINEQLEAAKPDVATCAAAKDPDNPFVVEWSGANLSALEAASQQGLVVVSYDCSALKVLTNCKAEGTYTLAALTPSRDGFEVSSKEELFARLPLGALSLQGEVSQSRSLRLDYVITGQKRATPERPKRVSGKCDGATHFIKAITVGAFALDARAGSSVGAGLTIGGVGGGAGTSGESKRLKGSGDVAACDTDDAIARPRCVAPLQVRLEAISIADIGLERAGFGQGLGGITTSSPVIPDVAEFSRGVGAMSFGDADTVLLDLWQAALRAEKSKASKTDDKLRAWEAVVQHKDGQHKQIETARERRAAWAERKAAEDEAQRAQTKRCSELHGVASQKAADEAKLAKLLAYDDDVISAAQKGAYRRELEQAYARWAGPLKERAERCHALSRNLPTGQVHPSEGRVQTEDSPAELYASAVLLDSRGQSRRAAATFLRYAALFREHEQASDALFQAGLIYHKLGAWNEAINTFGSFLGEYGTSARHSERVLEASCRIGQAELRRKNEQGALQTFRRCVEDFKQPGFSQVDGAARHAAMCAFEIAEHNFRNYESITIEGSSKRQTAALVRKAELRTVVEKHYREVLGYGQAETSVAALYRIGHSYDRFAESMRNADTPPEFRTDADLATEYRLQLEEKAAVLDRRALIAYQQAHEEAKKNRIVSEWTGLIIKGLNKHAPTNRTSEGAPSTTLR
jgi:tetratricopeptide (TPR) repeat protein